MCTTVPHACRSTCTCQFADLSTFSLSHTANGSLTGTVLCMKLRDSCYSVSATKTSTKEKKVASLIVSGLYHLFTLWFCHRVDSCEVKSPYDFFPFPKQWCCHFCTRLSIKTAACDKIVLHHKHNSMTSNYPVPLPQNNVSKPSTPARRPEPAFLNDFIEHKFKLFLLDCGRSVVLFPTDHE